MIAVLKHLEDRGRDASGVGWIRGDGQFMCWKHAVPAGKLAEMVAQKKVHLWKKPPRSLMLHARMATSGSPKHNKNNHPLVVFKPIMVAVVHNGIVTNPDTILKKKTGRTPRTECDTEAIAQLLAEGLAKHGTWERAVEELEGVEGSAAFAAMSPTLPDQVLIAKCSNGGNPLVVAADTRAQVMWWASTLSMLPLLLEWTFGDLVIPQDPPFKEVAEGSGIVFSREGIKTIAVPKFRYGGYYGEDWWRRRPIHDPNFWRRLPNGAWVGGGENRDGPVTPANGTALTTLENNDVPYPETVQKSIERHLRKQGRSIHGMTDLEWNGEGM